MDHTMYGYKHRYSTDLYQQRIVRSTQIGYYSGPWKALLEEAKWRCCLCLFNKFKSWPEKGNFFPCLKAVLWSVLVLDSGKFINPNSPSIQDEFCLYAKDMTTLVSIIYCLYISTLNFMYSFGRIYWHIVAAWRLQQGVLPDLHILGISHVA